MSGMGGSWWRRRKKKQKDMVEGKSMANQYPWLGENTCAKGTASIAFLL